MNRKRESNQVRSERKRKFPKQWCGKKVKLCVSNKKTKQKRKWKGQRFLSNKKKKKKGNKRIKKINKWNRSIDIQ